jgi:hypothetical protein
MRVRQLKNVVRQEMGERTRYRAYMPRPGLTVLREPVGLRKAPFRREICFLTWLELNWAGSPPDCNDLSIAAPACATAIVHQAWLESLLA